MKAVVAVALVVLAVASVVVLCRMYREGAVYSPLRSSACYRAGKGHGGRAQGAEFCDISLIDLELRPELKREVDRISLDPKSGKHVVVPGWKSGRTLPTDVCVEMIPGLIDLYRSLAAHVSKVIGKPVTTTPLELPTSCSVLVYEKEGDFINWHYDVNYFRGRFFTLLIPVTVDDTCTKYVYKDVDGKDLRLTIPSGKALLFEGDNVFHMASKICEGQRRVIVSMQFVTDAHVSQVSHMYMGFKDIAYTGL
jgi:hypothetical protein